MENRSLRQQAMDELESEACACGAPKVRRRSFCTRCFFSLPESTRRELYKRIGCGYEEAYDEAKELLKAEGRIRK